MRAVVLLSTVIIRSVSADWETWEVRTDGVCRRASRRRAFTHALYRHLRILSDPHSRSLLATVPWLPLLPTNDRREWNACWRRDVLAYRSWICVRRVGGR